MAEQNTPVSARFRKAVKLVIDDVVEEHKLATNDFSYNRKRLLQDALENYVPNFWLRVRKYEDELKGEETHDGDKHES